MDWKPITFNDILFTYKMKINNTQMKYERQLITEEVYDSIITEALYWFEQLKDFLPLEQICTIRKPTDKEDEELNSPFEVIEYREDIIPVYQDDYGQQFYAIIFGREYGGGSYNIAPHRDFLFLYDSIKLKNDKE